MTTNHQYQALLSDLPIIVVEPNSEALPTLLLELAQQALKLPLTSLDHADVHWLNPEESLKIEVVRQLQEAVSYKPYSLDASLFILTHLESASLPAQQALLKLLEEPPSHVKLLLTVSHLSGILPTILSRTQVWYAAGSPSEETSLELVAWYQDLGNTPLGKAIEVADTLSDREAALTWASQLQHWLHQQLQQQLASPLDQPQARISLKHLQITQDLLAWLDANVNLKLAVTEAVIRFKKAI